MATEHCGCLYFASLGVRGCPHKVDVKCSHAPPYMTGWDKDWNYIHLCSQDELDRLMKMKSAGGCSRANEQRFAKLLVMREVFELGGDTGCDSPHGKRQRLEFRATNSEGSCINLPCALQG